VTAGQEVVVEAMKVEIPVVAETAGVLERVAVDPGTQVQSGGLLLILSS